MHARSVGCEKLLLICSPLLMFETHNVCNGKTVMLSLTLSNVDVTWGRYSLIDF